METQNKRERFRRNWKYNFFTIWTGQAFSKLSSSVLQFAIIWYLTDQTGSAMVLSAAMFLGFLPQGVLGPLIGVFIDRYQRKKIMILSDLFISFASFMIVAAAWMDCLSTGLILSILFLRSVGTAFHSPCLQAVTPQIVPKDQLTRCAGYSQTFQSISDVISPVLAAMLYQVWSLGSIVFLDVIGALIAVMAVAVSRIPALKSEEKKELHVLHETAEGFQIIMKKRGIMGLILISMLYTLALMPTSALFPLMSMSYFGGTSTHAGIVEFVFSVGLVIGSLILSIWGGTKNRLYTIIISYLIMGASLTISGLLPEQGFVGFAACALFMGISGPFYWGMFHSVLQSSFEARYLGRVMSLAASIRLISSPVGLFFSGILAENFGVEKWFLIAGGLVFFAAALCAGIPAVRRCDSRDSQL